MSEYPITTIPLGSIKGRKCVKPEHDGAKQVFRFSNIPFAKPPVQDLRFEPPQKIEPWQGVLDCTVQSPCPMQPAEMASSLKGAMALPNEHEESFTDFKEDCLYLNVYTSSTDVNSKLPVLFWIFGGGFQVGESVSYDGNVLASLHDVVVVVPNYRLSCFGFLSFSGENSPCTGNMGLLDQTMALEWCKDNIAHLGGDPNNITIFGESAGGVSVDMHVHSPHSRGLFHKAICHSGCSNFPTLIRDPSQNQVAVDRLVKHFDIKETDPSGQFKELKKVPTDKLIECVFKMTKEFAFFTPVSKDPVFFPDGISNVKQNEAFNDVPQIIGANSTEGCGVLSTHYQTKGFNGGLSEEDGKMFLKQFAMMSAPTMPEKFTAIEEAVLKEYSKIFDIHNDKMFWSKMLGHINGDSSFVVPSIAQANAHSKKCPTYFYEMSQSVQYNHSPEYNKEKEPYFKSSFCECDHGDDINFTFGIPFSSAKLTIDASFTQEEREFSRQWMKYIVNFATSGNPNEGPYKMDLNWKSWNAKDKFYLKACQNLQLKQDLKSGLVDFWTKTFPDLLSAKDNKGTKF